MTHSRMYARTIFSLDIVGLALVEEHGSISIYKGWVF
jgi:hypothetical protein